MATNTAQSEFAFLRTADSPPEGTEGDNTKKTRQIEALHVPAGPSYVSISKKGRAKITKRPPRRGHAFVIHPVGVGPQSAVLVFPASGHQVRKNGIPAPLVAAVLPKDRLQFNSSDEVLHGTRLITNTVGPVPQDAVGTKCPLCRSPFKANSRVWICRCGQPLHLETPEDTDNGDEPLECALVTSTCPNCHGEVTTGQDAKYTYIPEYLGRED